MAGLRPAGSHCENSGSSDGSGASARSGRAKQRSLLCPLSERGWRHPYFSPCLIFWCFWIKPKAQKKNFKRRKIFRSILREASRPSIRRLLRGAGLPPFGDKRWCQKCPQGTSVGIGQRLSLSDHARSSPFAHDRSGRSRRCRHCFRYFRSAIPQAGGLLKYSFERFALRPQPKSGSPQPPMQRAASLRLRPPTHPPPATG